MQPVQVYSQASGNLVVGPTKTETEYVVLGLYENDWTIVAQLVARNGNAAVQAALADRSKFPSRARSTNVFVAIPARSWKPVKATEKVETTWELEEASA